MSVPLLGILDTTIRPICFEIPNMVTKETAAAVGPEKFKRYEHTLYVMAQLSRLVYCDTGIMWKCIQDSLGLSNDVVNKVISAYDKKFSDKRKIPITSQPGDGANRPMESYSLFPSKATDNTNKFGTYVSTADDMTCVFLKGSKIKNNPNSIFQPSDIIVSFKGSSTVDNFKHDLMSQITSADLGKLLQSIGVTVDNGQSGNYVTGAFVSPLVHAWTALMQALNEHVAASGSDAGRLFLTGHSLGGAYASLFAFILAEGKVGGTIPAMAMISSIHLITFGAPCILQDHARNTFNRHLDSGLITLDRVVSQKVSARSAATQVLMGGVGGPNDVIPTIPVGFSHPGYRPLIPLKNSYPESKGRPYSIDNIRKFYGAPTNTRYREPTTWPFNESVALGDRAKAAELNALVTSITSVTDIPAEPEAKAPEGKPAGNPTALEQDGGSLVKKAYDATFKKAYDAAFKYKDIYEAATLKRIPNFVSVQGSAYAYGFAHAEYLGMFFMGGFRLQGMKNPAKDKQAVFGLYEDGVKTTYIENSPALKDVVAKGQASNEPEDPSAPSTAPVAAPAAAPAKSVLGSIGSLFGTKKGGRRTKKRSVRRKQTRRR